MACSGSSSRCCTRPGRGPRGWSTRMPVDMRHLLSESLGEEKIAAPPHRRREGLAGGASRRARRQPGNRGAEGRGVQPGDNAIESRARGPRARWRSRRHIRGNNWPSACATPRRRHFAAPELKARLPALLPHPGHRGDPRQKGPGSACKWSTPSRKHGGRVVAESGGPGHGSAFTLSASNRARPYRPDPNR